VSGFCVHRPYAMGRPLAVGPHLARRFVRVCPPLFAAMLLSQLVAGRLLIGNVLWSLICELIYYAIYPALFILIKRCGWYAVLGAAFAGAVAMRLELGRDFGNYVDYGYALTWLIGLPCWLTGCYIAEKVDIARPSPSKRGLWGIRIGVWALGMVLSMLRFHTPIDFKWTLDFFAIPGGIWFVAEMRAARNSGLPAWMERAGAWSYSLYLFHEVGMYLVDATFPDSAGASWSIFLKWLLTVVAGFGLSWIMYRVIERPAHDWARWLSKRVPDGLRLSSGRALVPVPLNPT
jgi:peptidoglycan/LPS O-acetylase OafA/YrhL